MPTSCVKLSLFRKGIGNSFIQDQTKQTSVCFSVSVVQNHIKSRKPAESKEKLKDSVARELDIAKHSKLMTQRCTEREKHCQ